MNDFEKIYKYLSSWVGYCEKNKSTDLGESMEKPEDFTRNQGKNNFTIFAKDLKKYTGEDYQGQPWCDTFIDVCFIKAFGLEKAQRYLNGFSSYTPTSVKLFKKVGRYKKTPALGAIVFFKNLQRIHHTGFVYNVDIHKKRIYTIEGNTSKTNGVIANGGEVCKKNYAFLDGRIDGYGYIYYEEEIMNGWKLEANKWHFYENGEILKNAYFSNNGLLYYVDGNGDMVTGQKYINDDRHYFCEDGKLVGAELMIDDSEKNEVRIYEYTS